MGTKELNRDIKKLQRLVLNEGNEGLIRSEFVRLYYADLEFKYMNRSSILIMLRINIRFRIISLHNFGSFIELKDI